MHPSRDWRIVEIPEELRELARTTVQESKEEKKPAQPTTRKRSRPKKDDGCGEDLDYDTSSSKLRARIGEKSRLILSKQ
jgi:hypothetical protein